MKRLIKTGQAKGNNDTLLNDYRKANDLLKKLEWITSSENGEDDACYFCPSCKNEQSQGHKVGCELSDYLFNHIEVDQIVFEEQSSDSTN